MKILALQKFVLEKSSLIIKTSFLDSKVSKTTEANKICRIKPVNKYRKEIRFYFFWSV